MEFLWVIIFIIYSAYKAFNESKKKQEEARRQMQKRVPQTVDFEPIEPIGTIEEYRPETEDSVNKYQEKLDGARSIKRKKSAPLVVEELEDTPSTNYKELALSFDIDYMRQAVIMSEILQPPRAKRSYR